MAQQQQQPVMEHGREPCPDRILDDIGGAFAMGCVGGAIWHTVRSLRNSPSGFRMVSTFEAIRREAPRSGGNFANWGLAFSCFDCSLQYIRKKEDPWNAIWAGALTGGFLQLRHGLKSAASSAAFGGFLLALIEGVGITLNKMTSPPPPGVPYQPPQGPMGAPPGGPPPLFPGAEGAAAPSGGEAGGQPGFFDGLFSSMFGGGEKSSSEPVKETVLSEDSFAPPPLPEFQPDSNATGTDPGFRS